MSIRKVLIAHQSTIPHYRIPFYQAVEKLRPRWWEFAVIYDPDEARGKFFVEPTEGFKFRVQPSRTYHCRLRNKHICFQTFPLKAWNYDLLVVGSEIHNLSYPLSYFWRFAGKAVAYWGHGRDCSAEKQSFIKANAERAKVWLTSRADGFFAYTQGVREYMINRGVNGKTIFTLCNTIDIDKQRQAFHRLNGQREQLRKTAGLEGKKVLLFVGRLNHRKGLPFLFETFVRLSTLDSSYHMVLIGGGDPGVVQTLKARCGEDSVSYLGVLPDEELFPYYVLSDLYVFPGAVGLGPLQALCFNLTPAIIDSSTHNPEYEYLNTFNALVFPNGATVNEYAQGIHRHLVNHAQWSALRSQAWSSIEHLTIENMANNFIRGINTVLMRKEHVPGNW
jgi:glycosyltransferase involved in cell wall biosynthesis